MLYESLRAAGYGQCMNSSDLRYSGPVSRPGSGPMSSARWPRRAQESRPRGHIKHPDHRGRSALPWGGPAARRSLSGRTPYPRGGKGVKEPRIYRLTIGIGTTSVPPFHGHSLPNHAADAVLGLLLHVPTLYTSRARRGRNAAMPRKLCMEDKVVHA